MEEGGSLKFTVTPNEGYVVDTVTVNGNPIEKFTSPYTLENVSEDILLSATFKVVEEGTHVIHVSYNNEGGTVVPGTVVIADQGSQEFGIDAKDGYFIDSITADEQKISVTDENSMTYLAENVTADMQIEVIFKKKAEVSQTVMNQDTQITATGVFPEGTVLEVLRIESGDSYQAVSGFILQNVEAETFQLFDITLKNGDTVIQPDGTIQVSIPIPEGFGKKLALYRQEEDGRMTKLDITIEDGKAIFTTEHLSLFTIVKLVTEESGGDNQEPGTDDQKPGEDDQKPGTDSQDPVTNGQKPSTDELKSGDTNSSQNTQATKLAGGSHAQTVKTGDTAEMLMAVIALATAALAGAGAFVYRSKSKRMK